MRSAILLISLATCSMSSTVSDPPALSAGCPDYLYKMGLSSNFGVQYCEVFVFGEGGLKKDQGEVWVSKERDDGADPCVNFMSLTDEAFATAFPEGGLQFNGPRRWMTNCVAPYTLEDAMRRGTPQEARIVGDITFQMQAMLDPSDDHSTPMKYVINEVNRSVIMVWAAGQTVHELLDSEGAPYVMQSYSNRIDASLTSESLKDLRTRLQLPSGWSFRSRVLDTELTVVGTDGVAQVVWDELQNAYSKHDAPTTTTLTTTTLATRSTSESMSASIRCSALLPMLSVFVLFLLVS
eukprot:gnl/TRDRNA2_/TRDRNA2_41918_c1_seq1.p1 gnl/TRDRNA2_/TRDRNA2_41918_c1~~gnl/TRDRNA2_/TRDRNA2_41918_c1_seq1.p1  ORF type:complete len:294 (+),score=33.97 gnl/TRDRNA2_/TRDRNA2_41918_c1_seq1:59-940(+)